MSPVSTSTSNTTPPHPLTLPYTFDTRRHGRVVASAMLLGAAGLIVVFAVIALSGVDPALRFWMTAFLVLLGVADVLLALFLFRGAGGAFGTIGRVHVTVEPDRVLGVTTRTHRGTFPSSEFQAVELRRMGAGQSAMGKPVGILTLVGKNPALRLPVAVDAYPTLKPLADFLSRELSLTLSEPQP